MSVALLSVAGVALDALLGEPKRWHLFLYAALGMRSLGEHVVPVAQALRSGDLELARQRVGYLVSRQTSELDESAVARAATESVLENGSDAIFAALFWFAVAGVPGVVLYRLSNTLDAMWGYRNERFERFGWAAAKIDDLLNYVPARLVALTYALLGKTRLAGAGALGVELGGEAIYHGELHQRPQLGEGPVADADAIDRGWQLVRPGRVCRKPMMAWNAPPVPTTVRRWPCRYPVPRRRFKPCRKCVGQARSGCSRRVMPNMPRPGAATVTSCAKCWSTRSISFSTASTCWWWSTRTTPRA